MKSNNVFFLIKKEKKKKREKIFTVVNERGYEENGSWPLKMDYTFLMGLMGPSRKKIKYSSPSCNMMYLFSFPKS